jgi:phospholipid-transporting ATPase
VKHGELIYNASSPDELALANFARFCGCEFQGTDDEGHMKVKFQGGELRFKLLHVLEFNSTRKRMSIIIEDAAGNIKLLCKGADSILKPRLVPR